MRRRPTAVRDPAGEQHEEEEPGCCGCKGLYKQFVIGSEFFIHVGFNHFCFRLFRHLTKPVKSPIDRILPLNSNPKLDRYHLKVSFKVHRNF